MILDIVVVLLVAFGFYTGFSRGLIKTVFDTLSLFFGVVIALKFSPIVINFLEGIIKTSPAITFLIGIVVTFMLVMFIIRFVGNKLEDLFEAANINFINKIAGGAVQGIFFAFLLSLALWLLNSLNVLDPDLRDNSVTYRHLEPLPEKGKALFESVKPIFSDFWDKTMEAMDQVKEKAEGSYEETNTPTTPSPESE